MRQWLWWIIVLLACCAIGVLLSLTPLPLVLRVLAAFAAGALVAQLTYDRRHRS